MDTVKTSFAKSGHSFFDFQNRAGEASPLPLTSFAPELVFSKGSGVSYFSILSFKFCYDEMVLSCNMFYQNICIIKSCFIMQFKHQVRYYHFFIVKIIAESVGSLQMSKQNRKVLYYHDEEQLTFYQKVHMCGSFRRAPPKMKNIYYMIQKKKIKRFFHLWLVFVTRGLRLNSIKIFC